MSEFENLNNQTPTESDQSFAVSEESIAEPAKTPLASDSVCDNQVYNPTQSLYNLNQSPYRSRKKTNLGVIIAVVLGIIAMVAVVTAVSLFIMSNNGFFDRVPYMNSSAASDSTDSSYDPSTLQKPDASEEPEDTSRPDYVVPDFTPSGDSDMDLSNKFTQIYEKCSPSCCTVVVYKNGSAYSSGSGFVIDSENGYIATNHHVIANGDQVKVLFYNGEQYDATVVGSDVTTDLAVLVCDAENLVQVEFGDSDNIKVGENVIAIGTPYDLSLAGTMTSGIISGVARGVEMTNDAGKVVKIMTLLQTDCSINPGNSGGPLIDMAGNVVGITSLKLVIDAYEGIGFAIPITDAIEIFKSLIAGEPIPDNGVAVASPKIGVTVYELDYGLSYFNIEPKCAYPKGLLIGDIEVSSSSYKAGLGRFDIITDFNGYTIENIDDLNDALSNFKAGDEVSISVFRFDRNFKLGKAEVITFKLDAIEE